MRWPGMLLNWLLRTVDVSTSNVSCTSGFIRDRNKKLVNVLSNSICKIMNTRFYIQYGFTCFFTFWRPTASRHCLELLRNSHVITVVMTPEMSQYYRNMRFIVNVLLLCFVSLDGFDALVTQTWIPLNAVSDILELSYLIISAPNQEILLSQTSKIPTKWHYIALYYSLSHALHVSGAFHAHHQELSSLYSQTSGVDKTVCVQPSSTTTAGHKGKKQEWLRLEWMDNVELHLRNMGWKRWITRDLDRVEWTSDVGEAKVRLLRV
jgi:hypothetical protein